MINTKENVFRKLKLNIAYSGQTTNNHGPNWKERLDQTDPDCIQTHTVVTVILSALKGTTLETDFDMAWYNFDLAKPDSIEDNNKFLHWEGDEEMSDDHVEIDRYLKSRGITNALIRINYVDPIPRELTILVDELTLFDVQWSSCPIEVQDEVKVLWHDHPVYNDNYYVNWTHSDEQRKKYPIIDDYLFSRGVEKCMIHWWW